MTIPTALPRRDRTSRNPLGDAAHWINAAKFAAYAGMDAAAIEYLNKASLIAAIHDCDDTREIRRLADTLRARRETALRSAA